MPGTARASAGKVVFHILNRGNARNEVFPKDGDYSEFLKPLNQVCCADIMPFADIILEPAALVGQRLLERFCLSGTGQSASAADG